MSLIHSVTAYDRDTEKLVFGFPVPDDEMHKARELAQVPPEDSDVVGSYPLSETAARQLAVRLHLFIRPDHYDWFLEPFDPAS